MNKQKLPVLLDLFAGEGGASHGYALAGFEVWAVEQHRGRHERNPYGWHCGDWLDGLERALARGRVHAIAASPPCTKNTRGTAALRAREGSGRYASDPDLENVRDVLRDVGLPYVIENVEDAAPKMRSPLTLCGTEFGLRATDTDGAGLWLKRHRLFESNLPLLGAGGCHHPRHLRCAGAYGGARRNSEDARLIRKGGYVPADLEVLKALLGAPEWMTEQGVFLSVPPAYTEHLGRQMLEHLQREAA